MVDIFEAAEESLNINSKKAKREASKIKAMKQRSANKKRKRINIIESFNLHILGFQRILDEPRYSNYTMYEAVTFFHYREEIFAKLSFKKLKKAYVEEGKDFEKAIAEFGFTEKNLKKKCFN